MKEPPDWAAGTGVPTSAFMELLLQTAVLLLHITSGGLFLIWTTSTYPHVWMSSLALPSLAPPATRTQEVAERRVQHPEEQQELPELPLHGLLTLLEVPVLWAEGLVRSQSHQGLPGGLPPTPP